LESFLKKLKVLSLFSGVGGTEILLDKNKFDIIAHSEIMPLAISVLKYHYPNVPNLGDVRNIKSEDLPKYNLLLGGTPCQNLSYQGDRSGLKGDKSSLFFEYLRILKDTQPEYFLWENVKGALTSNKGEDFYLILKLFKEAGYEIQNRVFSGSDFGTIQARERVFIFGKRKDIKKETSKKLDSVVYGREQYRQDQGKKIIAYSKSTRKGHYDYRIRQDGLINTLTTGIGCVGQSTANYIYEDGLLRYLTPNECEKLMTWPKDWTKFGINEDGNVFNIPERERYRLIGNGIISSISNEILEQLLF
jgi:DNA (cytosine-5)-methyltransferase 1